MSNKPLSKLAVVCFGLGVGVLVCLAARDTAAQAVLDIEVDTPRDYGYVIGDKIRHEMHLTLSAGQQLDATTLPEIGRLNRWLEVSRIETRAGDHINGASYRILVEYQIVNAPQEPAFVTIPNMEFQTKGQPHPVTVFMPEWTFGIAPITHARARDTLRLQPARQARTIPVGGRQARLSVAAFLLTGILLLWAYRRWLLPRLQRSRYPFSSALRELLKLQRPEVTADDYRVGLKAFHAAVNTTAAQVIFRGNLREFVARTPKFAALELDLETQYARSRDVFFDNAEVVEPRAWLQELVKLCRRCRKLEREVT